VHEDHMSLMKIYGDPLAYYVSSVLNLEVMC